MSKRDDPLGDLYAMLRTALALVDELADEPLRERLLRAFARFPAPDRAVIVGVLEREADHLAVTEASEGGFTACRRMSPNPHARLYLRVTEDPAPYVSRDEMMLATLRAVRMLHGSLAELALDWQAATLDAFRTCTPEARASVAAFAREVLALVARSEAPPTTRVA